MDLTLRRASAAVITSVLPGNSPTGVFNRKSGVLSLADIEASVPWRALAQSDQMQRLPTARPPRLDHEKGPRPGRQTGARPDPGLKKLCAPAIVAGRLYQGRSARLAIFFALLPKADQAAANAREGDGDDAWPEQGVVSGVAWLLKPCSGLPGEKIQWITPMAQFLALLQTLLRGVEFYPYSRISRFHRVRQWQGQDGSLQLAAL